MAVRVGGFVAGLGLLFAASLAAGSAWGPALPAPPETHDEMGTATEAHGAEEAGHKEDGTAGHLPGGLMRSQDGYTLDLAAPTAQPGRDVPVALTVTGPDGAALDHEDDYAVEHDKRLHLIAVRRDLTGFQHVHPELDPGSGRWTSTLDLAPGAWRVFADFRAAGGPALTLGTDLTVPGDVEAPEPVRADVRTAEVDGYTVDLAGDLVAGSGSDLTLTVGRGGEPVTDLEPYLGAYGHLVALREGDLAYLHVHPHASDPEHGGGPDVEFTAEVPSEGRYRLFLDFKHGGEVRTASFDLTAVRR